jgi:hypothetical protein
MRRKSVIPAFLVLMLLAFQVVNARSVQTDCTPSVSFWSLLDSVGIGYADGRVNIERLYAVCLPAPAKPSNTAYDYDPDSGSKLTTLIKSADGKLLNTYVWYARNISGLWELSSYKVLGGAVKPLTAGNYLLEFAADDKLFYRFPFVVVEGKNDDPYQPAGTRYFIEGAWNEYGNIFYQRNDPESVLKFTTWLQGKSGKDEKTFTPYELKLVSLKDGKVIAWDASGFRLQPRWQKADVLLHPAGGDKNSYLKAGELLRTDGKYAFRLTVDGKPYGNYPFEVKQGKIQFQGKQIAEKTDPRVAIVDRLSGGRYTSWWIERE